MFRLYKKEKNKPAVVAPPSRHRRRRLAAPPRRAASQRRRPQHPLDLEKRRLAGGRSSQRRRGACHRCRTSLLRCSPEVGARRRAARPGGGSGKEREKRERGKGIWEREVVGRGIDNIMWVWGPPHWWKLSVPLQTCGHPRKQLWGEPRWLHCMLLYFWLLMAVWNFGCGLLWTVCPVVCSRQSSSFFWSRQIT